MDDKRRSESSRNVSDPRVFATPEGLAVVLHAAALLAEIRIGETHGARVAHRVLKASCGGATCPLLTALCSDTIE
jgi:hypothetical protein